MTQCFSSSNTSQSHPKNYKCPVNGKQYNSVSPITIMHHIKEPWKWSPSKQGYYFCDDPDCGVVYFSQDDSTITKSSLRTKVGIKEKTASSLICYCFGVTNNIANNKHVKDFVIKNTYCCKYNSDTTHMAKVGFLDYSKTEIKDKLDWYDECHDIKKTVECKPPIWHHDVELSKFIAAKTHQTILDFKEQYKQTYQAVESRKFSDFNYPVKKENMNNFVALDYCHLFHHIFNFSDREYEQELYIYDRCRAIINHTSRYQYLN